MKQQHVILPVRHGQKLDANYDRIFSYLNARQATVHLLVINDHTPIVYSDSAALRAQQAQVHKMTQFLKFEMLDRLAMDVQENYPQLSFEYHVELEPLNRAIAKLRDHIDAQMLIVDQRSLMANDPKNEDRALQYLVSMLDMPIWLVGDREDKQGDVAIAVDLPAHNHQVDQLNRALLVTGDHFANDNQKPLHLVHCWQSTGEQFMRSWLQLTEIDVARYAKVERQQRESQLQEYLADYNHDNVDHAQTQLHVIDGPANETIAQFCEQTAIGLLIIGHSQNPYGPIGHVTSELVGQNRSDMLILPQNNRANFTALPQTRFIDAAPLKQMS